MSFTFADLASAIMAVGKTVPGVEDFDVIMSVPPVVHSVECALNIDIDEDAKTVTLRIGEENEPRETYTRYQ